MQARTRKKRLEYLNKALEAEPENVDAQLMQIQCTYDSKPDEQLPELYDLMKKAETQMLLPLAMLYYKMNQFDKAQEYIRRLAAVNKDTKKFLRLAAKEDMAGLQMASGQFGYCPGTIEELTDELSAFEFLFASSPYFFKWALSYLRSETAAKRKK